MAAVGDTLDDEQRHRYGTGIHWTAGIVDEILNTALGLTPSPRAFPWQAHASGLGGNLAYGMTTEPMLEGLDRVA